MNEIEIKKLQESLDSGKILVYIDRDFGWKDAAYKVLKDNQDYELTESEEVMDLYRMYEFSDRFIALQESGQYGSIWNYVRQGIITEEEALRAVLEI